MNKLSFLPGCRIDEVGRVGPGTLLVVARSRRCGARCPDCGHTSKVVHSRYCRRPVDLPALGWEIRISLYVRRFYCRNEVCPKRTFAERLGLLLAPYARRTRRLEKAQGRIGIALGGEAGARLSRLLAMPVSSDTILRLLRRVPLSVNETPRVVGVDDWAFRKGRSYGTIVVDLERRRVLDLLPDRTAGTIAAWLRERPQIEVVARDRSTEYARGIADGARKAIQVADRWHLLANTRQMVERWLAGAHARLRRLPAVSAEGQVATPRRTGAFPRSRSETTAGEDSRARRRALYEEVRRRHAAGGTLLGISRAMGLARGTVRRLAHAEEFPERVRSQPGPSTLDPFLGHLEARVAEGCENGMTLWREVQALGFKGGPKQVRRWLQGQRTMPAKHTPHKWRNVEPAAGRQVAPALSSPRRLAWLLVRPTLTLTSEEAAMVARVEQDAQAAKVAQSARSLAAIVHAACKADKKNEPAAELDAWLAEARSCGIEALETFAAGLEQDGTAVRAALTTPWSSGQAEGQINRLKLLKRQMYGRASLDLLRRRTLLAA